MQHEAKRIAYIYHVKFMIVIVVLVCCCSDLFSIIVCDIMEYPIAFMTFSVESFVHLIDWKLKKSVNDFHHVRIHSVYVECMRCVFVG